MTKPLIYINNYSTFKTQKISTSSDNNKYITGDSLTEIEGTPDIYYENIVYIKDINKIWNRGHLYGENVDINKLKKLSNIVSTYDGKNKISIIEEDGRSYLDSGGSLSTYIEYGIMPTLSIDYEFILNNEGTNGDGTIYPVFTLDEILQLKLLGCDIINSGDLNNQLESIGIVTGCYNRTYKEQSDSDILKYEGNGITTGTGLNTIETDHLNFTKIYLNDNNVDEILTLISSLDELSSTWLIIAIKSCTDDSTDDFNSASIYGPCSSSSIELICSSISDANADYVSITDGISAFASKLNINDSFKILSNGDADITLSSTSNQKITEYVETNINFESLNDDFKNALSSYITSIINEMNIILLN